jgi:hypothetical protein
MASGIRETMRAARYLKVGDHVRVPSNSGFSMTYAVLKEKRPAKRKFSRGAAYDLVLEHDSSMYTHPSDSGKTWRVYVLGEDKFEVQKNVSPGPPLPPGTSRG